MGLFGAFADFLRGPVGNGLQNDPADVRNTKRNLGRSGFFDDETENDFITGELDSSIRSFQRDRGLREDGRLFPGGETEREILRTLEQRDPDPFFSQDVDDGGSVGFGGNISGTLERKSRERRRPAFSTAFESPITEALPAIARDQSSDSKLEEKTVEYDATGRMIKTPGGLNLKMKLNSKDRTKPSDSSKNKNPKPILPPPTSKPVDKEELQKILDFDPDRGGGDLNSLLKFGMEPKNIANKANEAARKKFPYKKGVNDEADAFRHALGSYLMTQKYGAENAKLILDRHERKPISHLSPKNVDGGELQDLYNNKIGRDAALAPKNRDRDPVEVIKDLYDAGKLQTRPFLLKKNRK